MKKIYTKPNFDLSKVRKTQLKQISQFVTAGKLTKHKFNQFVKFIREIIINKLNYETAFVSSSFEEIINSFNLFCDTCSNEINKNREWKDTVISLQSLYSLYIRNYVRQLRSLSYIKAYIFLPNDNYHHLQVIYVSVRMMLFILKVLTWDKTLLEPVLVRGMIGHSSYLTFFSKPMSWTDLFDFINSYRYVGNSTCEKIIHQRNCCWLMESLCNALLRFAITYPWFKFTNVFSTAFLDHNIEFVPTNISRRDIANVARFITNFNKNNNSEMLANIKLFIQRSVDIYTEFEADTSRYSTVKEQTVQDRHSAAWGILDTMHLTGICVALDEDYGERANLIKLCNTLENTLGYITKIEKLNIYRNLNYLLKTRYNVWVDQDVISTRVFGENSVHVMRTSRIPF